MSLPEFKDLKMVVKIGLKRKLNQLKNFQVKMLKFEQNFLEVTNASLLETFKMLNKKEFDEIKKTV